MLKDRYTHDDLKRMTNSELRDLAEALRRTLIKTVSQNGGHLSSNLGVVELTIALNSVFESPKDVIFFDVGHQAYVHKLLTGRADRFHTLRKKGGVSGFPTRTESEHDVMTTGHSSTSISAALGIARANRLMNDEGKVVVVIGDGAMTGGMCYEALNDAGQAGVPLIVVLNDNEMSISQNVGALSYHLTRLRQSVPYLRAKKGTKSALSRLPRLGKPILRIMTRIQSVFRALLVKENFFSALGFSYLGPIDGHDMKSLITALSKSRDAARPILLHIVTKKGSGYRPAEDSPDVYHGVAPFFVSSGEMVSASEVSNGQVASEMLMSLAKDNPRIAVVTAAMPVGTGMQSFADAYPDRFFDVGIAEEHAVTMAGGMAIKGMRPFVAIYSTFLQRAYDQIMLDVCLQNAPVTFLVDRGGLNGADGATHQGVFDLSFLRHMPNLVIAAPRDVRELQRMIALSLTLAGPMAIHYPREAIDMGARMEAEDEMVIGKWEMLATGGDVVIIAASRMVSVALGALIELHGRNVACSVVDARFIKPMDEAMIEECAGKYKLVVTLEDNALIGGFGSGVAEHLVHKGISARLLSLGVPDAFIPHASVSEQMDDLGLSSPKVARRILEALNEHAGG